MKLSEYCKFFEFTVEKGKFTDEDDGTEYKYMATDDQQCFHARYGNEPNDFIDQFGSMEEDYLLANLHEDLEDNYVEDYEKLVTILENSEYRDTEQYHIVKCLAGLEDLEDDLEES